MANKLIIVILVLLVVLLGGAGYYSFTLNRQIEYLGDRLNNFEAAQTARMNALGEELSTLRTVTLDSLGKLEGRLAETLSEIDVVKEDIKDTQDQVTELIEETTNITSEISSVTEHLNNISSSVLDASSVYQKVSQATVRITNGQSTIGSGVIYDNNGHVLTAQHVIDGLSPIYVILHDGRVSTAIVTGQCRFSDVAVLKLSIDPGIEPPPLADSSKLKIGEPVVAVGIPGEANSEKETITTGIISQVNRMLSYATEVGVSSLLQFDAAVNPGNSGGPLLNAKGEVIGIVVARINAAIGDGIYWAVSSNKAKRVASALIAQGFYDYPWIGVTITNLTPQILEERALETTNGVLVVSVGGPAQTAGIKIDDIIVSIDGVPFIDSAELISYLGEFKSVDDSAVIGLVRDSSRLEVTLKVGKRQQ